MLVYRSFRETKTRFKDVISYYKLGNYKPASFSLNWTFDHGKIYHKMGNYEHQKKEW